MDDPAAMAHDYVLTRTLAFHETDMAGIAHFSNFFRWMEMTEHAFLRSLGIEPVAQAGDQFWGWPRVRASCDYHAPLRFGDRFDCHLFVKEIKPKAIVYFFRFRKDCPDGACVAIARGEMTSVYAGFDVPSHTMRAMDLHSALVQRLEVAPAERMRDAKERPLD